MMKGRPPWLAILSVFISLLGSASIQASNGDPAAKILPDLYQAIVQERKEQARINQQREAQFLQQQAEKQQMLTALKQEQAQQKRALAQLKERVQASKQELEAKQLALNERSHALKDLYSAWKQVVKDSKHSLQNSLISHQYPEQLAQLETLAALPTLPETRHLALLGDLLQHAIQHSGESLSYQGWVAQTNGSKAQQSIQRIGPFSATSQGQFLLHDAQQNSLSVAPKQPADALLSIISAADFQQLAAQTHVQAVIDPSRGVVLERLSLSPDWQERIQQGGYIGYAIILLGLAGLVLAFIRGLLIASTRRKIQQQLDTLNQIKLDNPLGKIIAAYRNSLSGNELSSDDQSIGNTDSLEVRLQEIVLHEMPRLDKGLGLLKLLAAIAPLLGLLGTVVGMINTFQTITLVGNADPKLMAGGISQALMTTVLGLIVAVPLLFAHSYLAARSRALMVFLSQQSLGYIALSLENTQEKTQKNAHQKMAGQTQTPQNKEP